MGKVLLSLSLSVATVFSAFQTASNSTRRERVLQNQFVQVEQVTINSGHLGGMTGSSSEANVSLELARQSNGGDWIFMRGRSGRTKSEPASTGTEKFDATRLLGISLLDRPAKGYFERDAVKLDPQHNHVLLENDRVRVVSVHFGPGESGPIVDKRPRVIVLLSDMHAVVTLPDGHSEPRDGKAGTVYWGNAGAQATKNVSDKAFENIVVELKGK